MRPLNSPCRLGPTDHQRGRRQEVVRGAPALRGGRAAAYSRHGYEEQGLASVRPLCSAPQTPGKWTACATSTVLTFKTLCLFKSGAAGRNSYLEVLLKLADKYKKKMWG